MLYFFLVLVLILADLWFLGRMAVLENYTGYISVSYQKGQVGEDALDNYMKRDSMKGVSLAAAWKYADKTESISVSTGRSQKTDCYYVKGLPEAMFGNTLLSGRYFLNGEQEVCIISRRLSRELFGTQQAAGNALEVGEQIYKVTGIIEGETTLCVLPAEKGSTFDGVALKRKSEAQSVQQILSSLDVQIGSPRESVIDGQFYAAAAKIAYMLNLAVFLLFIYYTAGIKLLETKLHMQKKEKRRVIACLVWIVFLGIVIFGITGSGLGRDYLPTYWSDFEFYSKLWKEKAEALRAFSAYQEFVPQQQLWNCFLQTAAGSSMMVIIQVLAVFLYRGINLSIHKESNICINKNLPEQF